MFYRYIICQQGGCSTHKTSVTDVEQNRTQTGRDLSLTLRNPKNRRKYSVEFIAVKDNLTPLLGAKVIQQMGLIEVHEENFERVAATKTESQKTLTAHEIIEEYNDVFEGELGTLEGMQHLDVERPFPLGRRGCGKNETI